MSIGDRILTVPYTQARPVISNAMESAVTSPGELPPPPLRSFFGRDEMVDKIVGLAENVAPLALIGPGGIGKTSIALAVLHHDRIKKRFGNNCRFIRCDQFPASATHFLSRLSEVIGAGIENPKDLTLLRPFLSSREMILFLDNAESILDPQGMNAQEIYTMVKELSQFSNICLCLTSRISIIPPTCETLDIPTLSMEAAHDTFYSIYRNGGQSSLVDRILEELDFHPLSITLLATIAYHNKWDTNRLSREWGRQRTDILHTQHNESLAATIELSLASPMFQELGSNARDLLGVIAFFPQGIDENNLDQLFPTLSNRTSTFDNFCILSLTYRSNGFVTMLAPLRDYLYPKDPISSPLLHAIKDYYFHQLLIEVEPGYPGFEEAQWIVSEDVNVEHLLDVFTSINTNLDGVWNACAHFMKHLHWYKPRLVMLGPKIKELSDEHPSKPECLFRLSQLFNSVGHHMEEKQHLTYALELWRERGNYYWVAQTLRFLANANRLLKLRKEGIQQAKEALSIYRWLNNIPGQAHSWQELGRILYDNGQLDIAEKAIFRAISYNGSDQPLVCHCHSILGDIYHSQNKIEKAINHYEKALSIASPVSWHKAQFWDHYSLAKLFFIKNRFNDADVQVNYAKSYATNATYLLGRATELQAEFWYRQDKLKEAKSEALYAVNLYKELEVMRELGACTTLLQKIEEAMDKTVVSCK